MDYHEATQQSAPGVSTYAQEYRSPHASVRNNRSLAIAYIFWFILGQLSVHRFYLGATESAIAQVATFIGSLIMIFIFPPLGIVAFCFWVLWILADVFLMPGLHRKCNRKHAFSPDAFS